MLIGYPLRPSIPKGSRISAGAQSRLPATLELTLVAVLGATLLGVPLGMYAGYRPESLASRLIMSISIL